MSDRSKTKADLISESARLRKRIQELESLMNEHELARDYLENVLENSPDAIGIVDRKGRFIKWNRMAEQLYGFTFPELRGKPSYELYAEQEALEKMLVKLRSDGYIKNYEIDMRRKDGSIIPLEVSITMLKDSENRLSGSVCVARDQSNLKKALNDLEKSNVRLQEEITERKRIEDALRRSEAQLRFLSSRLLSVQEEERKRIAAELHDSIGSSLGAVKFSMENVMNRHRKDISNPEAILYSIKIIQHSIDEVRRIYMDLRPSLLDDIGLIATIDWFCRQFQSIHSGIFVEKEIDAQEDAIPEELKIVMFRIVQEALHNVAKYSKAEWVKISVTSRDGTLTLAVEDQGVGFDPGSVCSTRYEGKGLGLVSMRERAELSGGSFELQSAAGRGTKIRAVWKSLPHKMGPSRSTRRARR
jgi:PAS domain S-box-containing protein